MLLEDGGKGYEEANGAIDEILRDVPRRVTESDRHSSSSLSAPTTVSQATTSPGRSAGG
jgi:hypothetical protein